MNSKQKRKLKREKENVFRSVDNQIHNIAQHTGLTRLMFPLMQKIANHYDARSSEVVCGYSGQPLYINDNVTEIIGACVLDKNKVCSYSIPQYNGGISENCMTYKLKILG